MILKKMMAGTVTALLFWNSAYANLAPTQAPPKKIEINAEELLSKSGDLRGQMTQGLQDARVLQELAKMGVDKKEVEQRLAAMSDQELKQIEQGLGRQAGGDVVVISVTTLLLIIIIILLVK